MGQEPSAPVCTKVWRSQSHGYPRTTAVNAVTHLPTTVTTASVSWDYSSEFSEKEVRYEKHN